MLHFEVNFVEVIVAAIATMIVGMLWYGPLFGKAWAKLNNMNMNDKSLKKKMRPAYFGSFLASIIMAAILSVVLGSFAVMDVGDALLIGLVSWAGPVATTMLINYAWAGKSFKLFMIDSFHHLANILVISAIVTAWV
jgi:hypothetical protein